MISNKHFDLFPPLSGIPCTLQPRWQSLLFHCLSQHSSEPQISGGGTQDVHEYVNYREDMTDLTSFSEAPPNL